MKYVNKLKYAIFWIYFSLILVFSCSSFAKSNLQNINFDNNKIELYFSEFTQIKTFTLDNPNRLVIDLKQVNFDKLFKKNIIKSNFKNFRHSLSQDKLRLVFETIDPIKIGKIDKINLKNSKSYQVIIEIIDILPKKVLNDLDFSEFVSNKINKFDQESSVISEIIFEDESSKSKKNNKPIIIIDAGHGGKDPGTIGKYLRIKEKNITLSYSKELYRQLKATNRYQIYMTRNSDKFISLKERVEIARQKKANLFISIHANAISDKRTSGFSIYTLSEKSSDKQAEMLASKENRADIINGVNFSDTSQDIVNVMIAMSQRKSMNNSARFAKFSVNSMQNSNINILKNAHRFAGFLVLTAPDMISVLVELGYLTNYNEEKKLNSYFYKRKVVKALVKAIDQYFDKYGVY